MLVIFQMKVEKVQFFTEPCPRLAYHEVIILLFL